MPLTTRIFAQELPEVTVEAVRRRKIVYNQNKYKQIVSVQDCPEKELVRLPKEKRCLVRPNLSDLRRLADARNYGTCE